MKQAKQIVDKVIMWVKHRKVALLVSLCNVLILTLLSYILNNQPLFTGEDLNQFAWIQVLKNKLGIENKVDKLEVLFVNIAYDKQLIELTDDYGMPVGNIDITDRSKLLSLLQMLHRTNRYAYIFLDVRFENGYHVPSIDSLLFAEIGSIRNIVVANHRGIEIADKSLLRKTAISDYDATIVATNFVRYRYSYDTLYSMPLYAYKELTHKTISRHWLFYTCDGRLCYNSLFIDFPIESFNEFEENGEKAYYNMGSDLLDNYSDEDFAMLTEGKFIVIGDMIEDMHDTYSGPKPGSVITYYAFQSLMEGKHFVRLWLIMLLAVVFFLISLSQFSHKSIWERIPIVRESKSKLLHFTLSFAEYTLLLSIIVVMLNIFWNVSTSIFVPSIYFAIQKVIINYKRTTI